MHFMPVKGNAHGVGGVAPEHGYQVHVCQVRPESRGRLWLKSPDPAAHPAIDPDYLSAPEDVETLLKGVEIARAIGRAPALARYNAGEAWPGDAVAPDAVLPLLREPATVLLPTNVAQFADGLDAPLEEVRLFLALRFSPNAITLVATAVGLVAAAAFAKGSYAAGLVGAVGRQGRHLAAAAQTDATPAASLSRS